MNNCPEYSFWNVIYSLSLGDGRTETCKTEAVVYEGETLNDAINSFWANVDLEYDTGCPPNSIKLIKIVPGNCCLQATEE